MKSYTTEGIILASKNFKEADNIIVIFTRHSGKKSFLANGVRKLKSKKRGHVQLFRKIKFSARESKFLDVITEVETLEAYPKIKKNLRKTSLAYFFLEVVGRMTREEDKNVTLYNLLDIYLKKIESTTMLKALREEFTKEVLITLGFWPASKPLPDPDVVLEQILEKKPYSIRVGKQLFSK